MSNQQAQQQEERRRAVEEQKDSLLAQILTQDARERCTYLFFWRCILIRMRLSVMMIVSQ